MNIKSITKIQDTLKREIRLSLDKNNLQRAIDLIDAYAYSCQWINNILRDDTIETCLKEISLRYISQEQTHESLDYKTIVFYDQIGTTICLGLQYLRALSKLGFNIIYIFENGLHSINNDFYKEVQLLCKEYYVFSSRKIHDKNGDFLANVIRKIILDHKPANIIVHQEATGALAMSMLYSIKGITKYKIIPGDHHFYLGYDCFDYFINFRPFGWSTSLYERKLPAEKIYNNSYYPIINDDIDFYGFPFETKGKIIILSGGATYKFAGSDEYYDILKSLLTIDNVVFVFLGYPTKELKLLKNNILYSNKIYFLGYRKDFSQIIRRIDILYNSYPFSGGLFCQTAAYYKKPIIAYTSEELKSANNVEEILGFPEKGKSITFTNKRQAIKYAKKLIFDKQFRQNQGELCNRMLVTEPYFNNRLNTILRKECSTINYNVINFDRQPLIDLYLHINNEVRADVLKLPSRVLGFKIFLTFRFLKYDLFKHFKYIVISICSGIYQLRKIVNSFKKK